MALPRPQPLLDSAEAERLRRRVRMTGVWGMMGLCLVMVSSCGMLVSSAADRLAGNLTEAIIDHDDAATVEAAGPAYLLMMDAMVRGNPKSARILVKASGLYSAYAGAFVQDPHRSGRLTARALDYGMRAVCLENPEDCSLRRVAFERFDGRIAELSREDVPLYFTLAVAWAGWIQARTADLDAMAELVRVETLMRRVLVLDEGHMHGGAHLYMGALSILLPPSLGGKPEKARYHFERAIELSNGRNLMVKVVYARQYARMLFDRPLHDRLLQEVIAANPHQQGFVLINTMAQQQAGQLLETAADYF